MWIEDVWVRVWNDVVELGSVNIFCVYLTSGVGFIVSPNGLPFVVHPTGCPIQYDEVQLGWSGQPVGSPSVMIQIVAQPSQWLQLSAALQTGCRVFSVQAQMNIFAWFCMSFVPTCFFFFFFSSTPDSRKCHFEEFISVPLKLKEVAEKIETGLELLGITGIEDKLQVGVPATWPHNWYWLYRWLHVSLPWAPVGTALIQGCHWKATGGHKGFEVQSCCTVSPLDIFGGNWICGVNVLNLKWLVWSWSKMI